MAHIVRNMDEMIFENVKGIEFQVSFVIPCVLVNLWLMKR
jgi:hypothetical protein